jgi:hypothetical protein
MAAVVARRAGKRKLFGAGERAHPANERNKLENSVCTSCDIQSVVGLRAKQQWLQAPRRGTYWIFGKQYLSVSRRPRREVRRQALHDDLDLRNGLNVHNGQITCRAVADALKLPYTPADQALQM